jgi:hypothetical protein
VLKPMLDDFLYFIRERENVRILKEAFLAPPWTKDPFLGAWRFCNVNRNDDTVTKWIYDNITWPYDRVAWPTSFFLLSVARFINWPDTLADLMKGGAMGFGWDPLTFCRIIRRRMDAKDKVYTGAYMIRAGTGEDAKLPKEEYLCKRVFNPLWSRKLEVRAFASCAEWDKFFSSIFGMGDFMRNQIITDMKYSHHLRGAPDWSTFVLAGPGTKRGLNRLYGYDLRADWKVSESTKALMEVREVVLDFDSCIGKVFLDLNNVSNCFCEFDKYQRLKNNEGAPRSRYTPRKGS